MRVQLCAARAAQQLRPAAAAAHGLLRASECCGASRACSGCAAAQHCARAAPQRQCAAPSCQLRRAGCLLHAVRASVRMPRVARALEAWSGALCGESALARTVGTSRARRSSDAARGAAAAAPRGACLRVGRGARAGAHAEHPLSPAQLAPRRARAQTRHGRLARTRRPRMRAAAGSAADPCGAAALRATQRTRRRRRTRRHLLRRLPAPRRLPRTRRRPRRVRTRRARASPLRRLRLLRCEASPTHTPLLRCQCHALAAAHLAACVTATSVA
jgi:hypothetical protein